VSAARLETTVGDGDPRVARHRRFERTETPNYSGGGYDVDDLRDRTTRGEPNGVATADDEIRSAATALTGPATWPAR
jgi:hypothetical protein